MNRIEAKAYRASKKLAQALDCTIEIDRVLHGSTYWVYGPPDVYGSFNNDVNVREDPLDGDHAAAGWTEVLDKLKTYQADLFFASIRIEASNGQAILEKANPSLLQTWMADPLDLDAAGVLADWFADQQHEDLEALVREAIRRIWC